MEKGAVMLNCANLFISSWIPSAALSGRQRAGAMYNSFSGSKPVSSSQSSLYTILIGVGVVVLLVILYHMFKKSR